MENREGVKEAWARVRDAILGHPRVQPHTHGNSLRSQLIELGIPNSILRRSIPNDRRPTKKRTILDLFKLCESLGIVEVYPDLLILAKAASIDEKDLPPLAPFRVTIQNFSVMHVEAVVIQAFSPPPLFQRMRPYGIIKKSDGTYRVVGRFGFELADERPTGFVWDQARGSEYLIIAEAWLNSVNEQYAVGYSTLPTLTMREGASRRVESTSVSGLSGARIISNSDTVYLRFDGIRLELGSYLGSSSSEVEDSVFDTASWPAMSSWIRHVDSSSRICGYWSTQYQGAGHECFGFAGEWNRVKRLPAAQSFPWGKAHCIDETGLVVGYVLSGSHLSCFRGSLWVEVEGEYRLVRVEEQPSFFHHCSGGRYVTGSALDGDSLLGLVLDLKDNSRTLVSKIVARDRGPSSRGIKLWGCNRAGWAVGFTHPLAEMSYAQEGSAVIVPPLSSIAYDMNYLLQDREIHSGGRNMGQIGKSLMLVYAESITDDGVVAVAAYSMLTRSDCVLLVRFI